MLSWLISGPFMYLAILVFILVTARKVWSIAQMPRHLRWDLYPIAHDGPQGSPYQEVDFWQKPRRVSLAHELAEMAEEILLLKRTFLYNRKMWFFSFPMHFAFYLIIAWLVLLVAGAALELATGLRISGNSTVGWAMLFNLATLAAGVAGLVLGVFGTAGLLWLRHTDENLKDFSAPITYFNLYLLLALFGVGLAAWWVNDPSFELARAYVRSLLSFSPMALPHPLMVLEALLFGLFLIYLPFSRMLHFAAKYFFYHNIMWDDEPVVRGSNLEKSIAGYLNYQMEWSAQHIVSGASWLQQATANPTAEVKKTNETKSQDKGLGQTGGHTFSA